MHFRASMNTSIFRDRKSKVKVIAWPRVQRQKHMEFDVRRVLISISVECFWLFSVILNCCSNFLSAVIKVLFVRNFRPWHWGQIFGLVLGLGNQALALALVLNYKFSPCCWVCDSEWILGIVGGDLYRAGTRPFVQPTVSEHWALSITVTFILFTAVRLLYEFEKYNDIFSVYLYDDNLSVDQHCCLQCFILLLVEVTELWYDQLLCDCIICKCCSLQFVNIL